MTAGNQGSDLATHAPIPGSVIMQQDEYYFVREQAFTQSQRFVFGSTEVKWFLIDPTNYIPGPTQEQGQIIFRLPGIKADAGPIFIDFYSAPDLGTAVATPLTYPSFNRVSDSAITAQLELSSLDVAPTVSLGTPLSQLMVAATATGIGNRSGDSLVESLPFSIGLTSPLLMVLTNTDGAGVNVSVRHGWFEI